MRLLVLGGTQFLGRAVAARAVACGHDVTCAARGLAGDAPAGVRFIVVDRDRLDGLGHLGDGVFDAAIDVSRHPGQVRRSRATLAGRVAHWTFVSTTSVYAGSVARGQTAVSAPLLAPTGASVQRSTPDSYGAAKVACEREFGHDAFICRPGLIVGPGDPTGRFSYWAARLARGGDVLVPAERDDSVQFIDVRDLACWIVEAAERRLAGRFDAVAPSLTRQGFVEGCVAALGIACRPTWVDAEFLARHGIGIGSGPHSLPYPMPDTVADSTRDVLASLAAGLAIRPLAETVRDTVAWLRSTGGPVAGLTPEEEALLLRDWSRRQRPG